ncbi:MAG: GrlR family regulatory protein [Phyllobacterium sp.]|uniref:GrlR family regulatory protein n=1 Tax=Phyllobacterium sp. TaxID=1871046 RepID=UPI0030EFC75B
MPNNFREGIYRAEFDTLTMQGIGLVVLRDGRVYGGDTLIYYVGTYSVSENVMTARVRAHPYKGAPSETIGSAFGHERNTLELEGKVNGDHVHLTARAKEAAGIGINIKLDFLHE